jgi:uncharacterized protein (TIGR04255 family)
MNEPPSKFPHLRKAPIVEAILDFRVRLPADFDVARFKAVHPAFENAYPRTEERKQVEHRFEHAPGREPSHSVTDRGIHGYFFRSADNAQIVQFRRDGFTFNRLKPYTSWEHVFPEAARFWKLYWETCQPIDVSRIAVRYINRLLLPDLQGEFSHYLAAPPALPNGMPPFVSGFVSRVVIHDPDSRITAAVVQALEPPLEGRYVPVILDIDVFQQDVSNLSPDAILARFEQLREMKNRVFFGSITDTTLEMLK